MRMNPGAAMGMGGKFTEINSLLPRFWPPAPEHFKLLLKKDFLKFTVWYVLSVQKL